MLGKELNIGLQYRKIREGHQIMGEVSDIIPDIEPIAYPGPALKVGQERGVFRAGGYRMGETAFDGTEPDYDIGPRLDGPGRLAAGLVSEGVDGLVRGLRFNRLGNLVDEVDDGAAVAAFL